MWHAYLLVVESQSNSIAFRLGAFGAIVVGFSIYLDYASDASTLDCIYSDCKADGLKRM
jgi:hypothetical protein